VIGGGAAGFFGAITCADHGMEDVLILEKGPELLDKVKISGGGRCNVMHACFEPGELVESYPRGRKSLLGPFHHWQTSETMEWFESRGVSLKTEQDGRMFPVTDDSRTIIDCLTGAARDAGVRWRTRCGVQAVRLGAGEGFRVETAPGEELEAAALLIATGGIRSGAARKPLTDLGHGFEPPVPSLFTFHIEDGRLEGLQGVSVGHSSVRAGKFSSEGPVLVTHWGLSGPAILKLSALGARELAEQDYQFELWVDWTGGKGVEGFAAMILKERREHGARKVLTRSPLEQFPRRLWERLAAAAGVTAATSWSNLTKDQERGLAGQLLEGRFAVRGKSLNKDEFVTCGGVRLQDVNLKTMESTFVPGLFFAGEVLDIDGITGGFNFQSAWTTGRIAGEAIARGFR
jgi:predicted Rossmann fold flavoprotein